MEPTGTGNLDLTYMRTGSQNLIQTFSTGYYTKTKKREKKFGSDEESVIEKSVKKRRWERKRRRGKKKLICERERQNERSEKKEI